MEIDYTQTFKGFISRFDVEKSYGYIETPSHGSFFFFIDTTIYRNKKELNEAHKFRAGDEVEFKVKKYTDGANKAYDLKFIQNTRRDKIINEATEFNTLKGYLKKVENKYFVKHLETYIFIPLAISEWETDLDLIYDDRINTLVLFELHNLKKPTQIFATLKDRVLKPEFRLLTEIKEANATTMASVTGKNEFGLFATIFNSTMKAFIRLVDAGEILEYSDSKKGDVVEVKVSSLSPESKIVILKIVPKKVDLTIVTERTFQFKHEHFGTSVVEKKTKTIIERTHGLVVNELANELSKMGYLIGNDSNRDLIIHDGTNNLKCIFEIKTSINSQSIYAAVGQLLMYSINIGSLIEPGLFIVLPDLLNDTVLGKLRDLKIEPIYYSWHEKMPIFHNLEKTLKKAIWIAP